MAKYNRNRRQSLTDRLQYWGIQDGVVITRQRGIEFGIEFTLPSAAVVTDDVRETLANRLHQIMVNCIPEGCRGRLIIESAPLNENQMLKVSEGQNVENDLLKYLGAENRRIMEKRRIDGTLSSWRYFFTVRLNNRQRKFGRPVPFTPSDLDPLMRRAQVIRSQMMNMMDTAGFESKVLSGQEAFNLIYRWFNPGLATSREPFFKSAFRSPKVSSQDIRRDMTLYSNSMREQVTNSEIDTSRVDAMVVGDRLVMTVNMLGVGDTTYPGMSERLLMRLSGHHMYYVIDMDHLSQNDTRKRLNNDARGAVLATTDASMGTPDLGNAAVIGSLAGVLQRLTVGDEHVFKFGISMVLIARSKEELESMKEIARTEMAMMGGLRAAYGTFQNIPMYLDRLAPLNAQNSDFMFRTFSSNLVHFVPQIGPWRGSLNPIALFRSRWGSVTGINPSDGTLSQGTLICGSAGSGKTFLTQSWITSMAITGADVMIVDQKRDYLSLITSLEGQFVPFYPGEKTISGEPVRFNAFELEPGVYEPDDQQKLYLVGFITALLGGKELAPSDKAIITATIEQVYKTSSTTNSQGETTFRPVTLSRFVNSMRELNQVGTESLKGNDEAAAIIRRLTLSLQTYIGGTTLGSFLDGESTVQVRNKYVYFDISGIGEDDALKRIALMLVTKLIWERAKLDRSIPKLAVIEEIGVLFSIPEALTFVSQLYKLGRSYNLWPVGITQEIADFQKGKGLINNTAQFLIGAVSEEESHMIVDLLGLPPASLDLIRSLSGQKGVYREFLAMTVKGEGMTGDVIQYYPNQIEYWMYTSNGPESVRRAKEIEKQGGNVLAAVKVLAGVAI